MTHHVLLTDRAQHDVEQIVDWLAERSVAGASSWLEALEEAMASLATNPERFAAILAAEFPSHTVRQHVFKTKRGHRYWLVYYVSGPSVQIVHVYGAGQNK
jgi:plasmid stabilization system protein ParE